MLHIDIYLDKWLNFDQKIKIPLALGIKNWRFQLKMAKEGSRNEKIHKSQTVDRVDQAVNRTRIGRSICRDWGFKETHALCFLHYSPPFL